MLPQDSDDADQPSDHDPSTLPPRNGLSADDATLPPEMTTDDDQTIPPTVSTQNDGVSIGDQIRYFGDYELVEEIARGGMGVVYQARQTNLNRIVALKMILAGQFAGQEDVQRFHTEAEAAAQLDHPGIVPIFEIGEHQGQHYFSMAYVEGESLAQRVIDGPLPPRKAVELVKNICSAIAYAHQRGVIHRDLKPANILLDQNGQPKVTDFGLAKKTESDSGLTGTGQILGTPAYMPPEQASGGVDDVGPLADVYSIGAILYCLLTGRPPFQASSSMDTLIQVLEQEPVSPRQLNHGVSKDLETISLKCLEKNPQRRYSSAQELADELQRLLEGSPIKARPVGRTARLWRWGKRHPWKAATVAALSFLVFLLAIGGPTVAFRETQLRLRADRASYGNRVQLAEREWQIGQVANAKRALEECPEELRGWEWNHVSRLCHQETLMLQGHSARVNDVAFHPDGHQLASASHDNTVLLWDVQTAKPIHTLKHAEGVIRVAYSPDGKLLATGGRENNVQLWNTETGTLVRKIEGHSDWIRSVAFSRDGTKIASASYDKTSKVWEVDSGDLLQTLTGHTNQVKGVSFHPDGNRLITAGEDSTIRLWDLKSGEQLRVLRGHGPIVSVEFDFLGKHIVAAGSDQTVRLWDTDSWRMVKTLEGHKHVVKVARFSPDGRHVVSGGIDRTIRIWDIHSGTSTRSYYHHTETVEGVCYSPDGRWIASSGGDGSVRIWDTQESESRTLEDNPEGVGGLAFAGNSRLLTAAGHGGRLWLPDTGWVVGEPFWHRQEAFCVAVDSNGKRSASGGRDSHINLWDIDQQSLIQSFPRGNGNVVSLAFSPDDQFLAAGCSDSVVRIYDLDSAPNLESVPSRELQHSGGVFRVVFDDNGKLFTASTDRKLSAWDFASGKKIAEQQINGLRHIAINLVRREIWAADQWGNLIAFSIDQPFKYKQHRSGAHSSNITGLAVSSDGSRIASGDQNGILKLWDASTAEPVLSLNEHSEEISAIAFSPDDRWLASASNRGKIRLRDSVIQNETSLKARWLVTRLTDQSYNVADLETAIKQADVSADVRGAATTYAEQLKASPNAWMAESDKTLSWNGSSRFVYERAHRQASAAIEGGMREPWGFEVLALAEFRLGNFEQALKELLRAKEASQEGAFELTSPVKAMALQKLGREAEARTALAQAWGFSNSSLMIIFGHDVVKRNRQMLNEAKQELLGRDAVDLEFLWLPRVDQAIAQSGIDVVQEVLESVPSQSSTARKLVPYLIAEQLVRQVAQRELVTSRIAEHFRANHQLPESIQEIAIAMAEQIATEPNRLYRSSQTLFTPGLSEQEYRLAADQVDEFMAILRVFPKGSQAMGRFVAHQGMAQYRLGQLEDCVESITRAKAMPFGQSAFSEAFLSMAHHRLGKTEEARVFLSEISKLREGLKSNPNHQLLPLLSEVERVLEVSNKNSIEQD